MSSPTPESNELRPRWLVGSSGKWQPLEPIHLLTAIHAAARQAGERDPFVIQDVAEGIWRLLMQEEHQRRVLSEAEFHERIVMLLDQLGRSDWARWFRVMGEGRLASARHPQQAVTRISPGASSGYESTPWQEIWQRGLQAYADEALQSLVPEPIADWHRQGTLVLHAIYHPHQLAAARASLLPKALQFSLPEAPSGARWPIFEHIERLHTWVGQAIVVPTPELELLSVRIGDVPALVRELALSSRYWGLSVILHLNYTTRHEESHAGSASLYERFDTAPSADRLAGSRQALLEALTPWLRKAPLQLVWHFGEDEVDEEVWRWLRRCWSQVAGKVAIAMPSQSDFVGEETLLAVTGISLSHLLAGWHCPSPEVVQQRCQSLVQLVVEWLGQWRERLCPILAVRAPPFAAERACGIFYLQGLGTVARHWFDSAKEQLQWIRQLLEGVRQKLQLAVRRGAPRCQVVSRPPRWVNVCRELAEWESKDSSLFCNIYHNDDWPLLRWRCHYLASCFDAIEVDWHFEELPTWDQFCLLLEELHRLPGLSRLWLCKTAQDQPALF